jgi:hypothetical protein
MRSEWRQHRLEEFEPVAVEIRVTQGSLAPMLASAQWQKAPLEKGQAVDSLGEHRLMQPVWVKAALAANGCASVDEQVQAHGLGLLTNGQFSRLGSLAAAVRRMTRLQRNGPSRR